MESKILMIDDDEIMCNQVKHLLDGENIAGYTLKVDFDRDFDSGRDKIRQGNYDLIFLDLYRGTANAGNSDMPGEQVLDQIKEQQFMPVIFFTALPNRVTHVKTDWVRVVNKADGFEKLKEEISNLMESELFSMNKKIEKYVRECTRDYFWNFVQPKWNELKDIKDKVSLVYLLVRRLSNSLSREKINGILGTTPSENVHPMEFYIYPYPEGEYATGDILMKDSETFVLMTPTCDLVLRRNLRKAENVVLVKCVKLVETSDYRKFESQGSDEDLRKLISDSKSRYFFLPGTHFIENSIADFQKVIFSKYDDLSGYEKTARLDDPFAQKILSRFVSYYNRIGSPDIDVDYVMENLS